MDKKTPKTEKNPTLYYLVLKGDKLDYKYDFDKSKFQMEYPGGLIEVIKLGLYLFAKFPKDINKIEIRNFKSDLVCTITDFNKVPPINWEAVKPVFEQNSLDTVELWERNHKTDPAIWDFKGERLNIEKLE